MRIVCKAPKRKGGCGACRLQGYAADKRNKIALKGGCCKGNCPTFTP
nr:MAG TPA: hypothetical protein [Bacteriophage sp.]